MKLRPDTTWAGVPPLAMLSVILYFEALWIGNIFMPIQILA
jgi:hypothetical protein